MLKPYSDYKSIKSDWMGNIPVHWDAQKIGGLFTERKEKVSDKDYAPLSVSRRGIVPQISTVAKSNDGENRKLVRNGDFAINSRSDRRGSSGLSVYDGSVSLINIVLCPRSSLNGRYTHYLLKSHSFIEEYYRNGRGIVADLWTTRYAEMKSIVLPLPPLSEQDQIVRYLDWQVSKTNKLISALKKQIVLLKEYKQAVINEAVTKGLDPNVQMKDSGVDWIGEIPLAWNVLRLKFACKVNANTKCDLSDEDMVVFLPMESISVDGKINNETKRKYKEVRNGFTCFQKNDVVVAKITPCFENGKGAWLSSLETDIGFGTTELIVLRAYENLLPEYLHLITHLDFFRREGAEKMTGSAGQKRIPSEFIANFRIGIPQIKDQRAIIAHLNEQRSKIDSLIEKVKSEIAVLGEYRTRLISDVVTGQIDVRDIEVPEFEYITDDTDDASDDENIDAEGMVDEEE